jgi:type IV secretion system protein VirB9
MNTFIWTVIKTLNCFFMLAILGMWPTEAVHAATTHQDYAYAEGKTYVVNTALGIATQIIVGRDEKVVDFGTGFSAGWELVRRDNVFYIKPKDADAETNMYIRTDKRSYVLDLRVVSKDWKKIDDAKTAGVHYVVQFTYPQDAALRRAVVIGKSADDTIDLALRQASVMGKSTDEPGSNLALRGAATLAKSADELTRDRTDRTASSEIIPTKMSIEPVGRKAYFTKYEVAADMSARWLVPMRVYDDGVFTYLQFAEGVNSPAIFARSSVRAQEYVVNKTVSGDTLQIVHGVHPVLVIRHGDSVVAVKRNN